MQFIKTKQPEQKRHRKHTQQAKNLFGCNTQNVPYQKCGILGEIAAPGQNHKAHRRPQRRKYGNNSVQRARILQDKKLAEMDIKGEEVKPFDRGGG